MLALLLLAGVDAPLAPTSKWKVDLIDSQCVLTRDFGSPAVLLRIARVPLSARDEVTVGLPTRPAGVSGGRVTLTLAEGGRNDGGPAAAGEVEGAFGVRGTVPHGFLRSLDGTTPLTVRIGTSEVATLADERIGAAMGALDACTGTLLKSWGFDPVALAAARSQPEPTSDPTRWIEVSDYPGWAIRNGVQGTSVVRFEVGLDGRARDCVVAKTSGNRELDDAACAALARKAHYTPAAGADGRPMVAPMVQRVRWQHHPGS